MSLGLWAELDELNCKVRDLVNQVEKLETVIRARLKEEADARNRGIVDI